VRLITMVVKVADAAYIKVIARYAI
jgi:hypothetical protein